MSKNLISILQEERKSSFIQKRLPRVGDVLFISFYQVEKGKKITKFKLQNFLGLCIGINKLNTFFGSILIRNVLNKDPIEFRFYLNSPFVRNFIILSSSRKNFYKRNKLYYLRNKSLYYSRV